MVSSQHSHISNAKWSFSTLVIARLAGFIAVVLLSSVLSVEDFARYSVIMGIAGFCVPMCVLGFGSYCKEMYTSLADDPAGQFTIAIQFVFLSFIAGAVISTIMWIIDPMPLLPRHSYFYLFFGVCAGAIVAICNALDVVNSNPVHRLVYLGFGGMAAVAGYVMYAAVFADGFVPAFMFVVLTPALFAASLKCVSISAISLSDLSLRQFISHVSASSKYVFHGLAMLILVSSDRVMLGALSTPEQTAIFTVSSQFGIAIGMVGLLCEQIYISVLLKSRGAKQSLVALVNDLAPLGYILAGGILYLAFNLFVSAEYTVEPSILLLLFASYYIFYVYTYCLNLLIANGYGARVPRITLLWAAINVLANYFFLPTCGAVGAALSTFGCYLGLSIHVYLIAKRYRLDLDQLGYFMGTCCFVVIFAFTVPHSAFSILILMGLLASCALRSTPQILALCRGQ